MRLKILIHILTFLTYAAYAGMGAGMSSGKQFNINLLAGINQGNGNVDGVGGNAKFGGARGIVLNSSGHIYVTDQGTIRRIVVSGTIGTVTTLAGGVTGGNNGNGLNAEFGYLPSMAIDTSDNLYVACDYYCEPVRKIDTSFNVTDHIDGTSGISNPNSLVLDSSGNIFTVADCAIYKTTTSGTTTLFSGSPGNCAGVDGVSTTARFRFISQGQLYYHQSTNEIFSAEADNYAIRKIDASGTVTTFAGVIGDSGFSNGVSTTARFGYPTSITYDVSLNSFFVTDSGNQAIRKITMSGTVTTHTGDTSNDYRRIIDGTSATAILNGLTGIVSNGSGTFYILDNGGGSIRKVDSLGNVTTIAGIMSGTRATVDSPIGSEARFVDIESVTKDNLGNLYLLESPWSFKIRKVTPKGVVTTFADASCWTQDGRILYHSDGNIYFKCYNDPKIRKMTVSGTITDFSGSGVSGVADGVSSTAQFIYITGMIEGPNGSIYVADDCSVRKVSTSGTVSTIAGSSNYCGRTKGAIASSRFEYLYDIVVDSFGDIFVSEIYGGVISKINISSGTVSIFAGAYDNQGFANGTGATAQFSGIGSMAIDPRDNIYVADKNNHAIRKITPSAVVTTPIGRKMGAVVPQFGLQTGPLPSSANSETILLYNKNILYMISPGGIFMAPAN